MRKSIIVIALLAILAHSVPAQTKDFTFSIQINPAHPIVEIMLLGGGWDAFIFLGGLNIEMGLVDRMSMGLDTAVSTVTLDSFYNGFIFSFTPQFIFYPQRNRMRGWYIDCVSQQSQPQ
ncbi:MAG: hypothetical protein LBG74_07240 [Spirochaetaceae bacterium]|nr:hypothetical protein [Spirochaetaceae bacterium]